MGDSIGPAEQRFIEQACRYLEQYGPASANQIAGEFGMTNNTVRTWLHRMYQLGWLNREKPEGNTYLYRYEPV